MWKQKEKPLKGFDSFEEFFEQAEERPSYWEERAKLEFTREVLSNMNRVGVSKSVLAGLLDVQPGMVTRLLSGRNNFELSTMVRLALALDCRFRSHLEPIGSKAVWFDVLDAVPNRQNVVPWNPKEFRSVEVFSETSERMTYAPVPSAA